MESPLTLLGLVVLVVSRTVADVQIPLEVEQPPTITKHTSGRVTVLPFPFNESISFSCEAKGNPPPQWTKDGKDFTPPQSATSKTQPQSNGNFVLTNSPRAKLQGTYQCYASNKLGTAMTDQIQLILPSSPKFPKEKIEPIVVEEGQPFVLQCDPPTGLTPRKLYWMSIGLHLIEQNARVSMGLNGNLYISNAMQNDTRQDYCCFASFTSIRAIVQKTTMAVLVTPRAVPMARRPSLLLPSGVQTELVILKGNTLELECIPEGFPTPTVEWKKWGEQLPSRAERVNFGKLLTVAHVSEEDEGKYICKVRNTVGEAIHYFDPPKWLPEPPPSQLVVTGSKVIIKCMVGGKPRPDIAWRRNGVPLTGEDVPERWQILDDTVVLLNVEPEDSGVYQCEASNVHGRLLANTNIMVLDMAPLMLTGDRQVYEVIRGHDAIMNCSVFGSPPPTVTW
ncbi:hypothetical protein CRUP_024986 [Coryphaenoides rupestris]|nr:hypothetical protein CRUP_024986 [Coryphaenoides rupestris]